MPGNIFDVIALENTIETLDFLVKAGLHFILDRGFYSESNVDALFDVFKIELNYELISPLFNNRYTGAFGSAS